MIDIIVPTAKLVNEDLQKLGKLPPVIYPVNGRIGFDFIYDKYKNHCNSVRVLCYEQFNKVKDRLKGYNDNRIETIKIPQIRDLGYTIYCGIEDVSKSKIVINFGDSLVNSDEIVKYENSFYYSDDYMSDKWTFFDIDDGVLTNICDKSYTNGFTLEKRNFFCGVFYLSDSDYFKMCLEKALKDTRHQISSFYIALTEYSTKYPLKALKTDDWWDIGHIDRYYNTILEVKAREFNHIIIDSKRGILKKTSENKEKFIGEIKWYLKLPSNIEYLVPRIFSYSLEYRMPYIEMEYYSYHTLHELYINADLSVVQWKSIFERLKFISNELHKYVLKNEGIIDSLSDIYLFKTIERLNQLRSNKKFETFFKKELYINNKKYPNLTVLEEKLKDIVPKMLYNINELTIIHGDLCLTNILIDENLSIVKLIDPRGKFGKYDIYGDRRYDIAKLLHSLDGKYDYIIKDMFSLKYNAQKNEINFNVFMSEKDKEICGVFLDVFKDEIGNEMKNICLIEALLFLTMVPLHNENFSRQLAMLSTGVEKLNNVISLSEES